MWHEKCCDMKNVVTWKILWHEKCCDMKNVVTWKTLWHEKWCDMKKVETWKIMCDKALKKLWNHQGQNDRAKLKVILTSDDKSFCFLEWRIGQSSCFPISLIFFASTSRVFKPCFRARCCRRRVCIWDLRCLASMTASRQRSEGSPLAMARHLAHGSTISTVKVENWFRIVNIKRDQV